MLSDPHSSFTNDELAGLKQVYTQACSQLGIGISADLGPLRERVASLVMELARQGVCDGELIKARVLSEMKGLREEGSRPSEQVGPRFAALHASERTAP